MRVIFRTSAILAFLCFSVVAIAAPGPKNRQDIIKVGVNNPPPPPAGPVNRTAPPGVTKVSLPPPAGLCSILPLCTAD
jgi:hypothetical protein